MNRAERDRDISNYDSALQGLNIGEEQKAKAQQKFNEEAESYNHIVSGVLEPLGAEFTKKPIEDLVKSGARKLVGKGKKVVSDVAKDLKEGKNPADRLAENAKKALEDVKKGVSRTKDNLDEMGKGARKFVNRSRQARGLKAPRESAETSDEPLFKDLKPRRGKLFPEVEQGEGLTQEALPKSDVPTDSIFKPTNANDLNLDTLPEPKAINLGGDNPADLDDFTQNMVDKMASGDIDMGEGLARISRMKTILRATNPLADSNALDSTAPMRQGRLTKLTQPKPQASDPEGVSRPQAKPADEGTPNSLSQETTLKPKLKPKGKVLGDDDAGADVGAGAGGDAETGLEGASEALDAVAGAEGGLNIFADIASGLAGLGLLIAGAVPSQKPKQAQVNVVNPSTQFGI